MSAAEPPSGLRHRLTVAFVLFHALAIVVLSVPSPRGARQDGTWADRNLREQVLGWVAPFRSLLGGRSDAEVLALVRGLASDVLDVRDVLVAPFQPYVQLVGAHQGWQMFGSLNSHPARLRIRIASGEHGPWKDIYLARDPNLAWRQALMDEERTRALVNNWSWGREKPDYQRFTRRWAALVAEDYPDAAVVEFAMMRYTVPEPEALDPARPPETHAEWIERVPVRPAVEP